MTQGTSVSRGQSGGESKDISILILLLEITIKDNKENPTLVKLTDIRKLESIQSLKRKPMKKGKGYSRTEGGINVGPPERATNRNQANSMAHQYQKKRKHYIN